MIPQSTAAALQIIKEVTDKVDQYSNVMGKSQSLVSFTKPLRVEPYTIVDSTLTYVDFMPEVMQSLQSNFTGFWLLAADMLASCQAAKALSVLERVNPSRDAGYADFAARLARTFTTESLYWSRESYKFGFPSQHSWQVRSAAQEAADNGGKVSDTLSKNTSQNVNDVANLSVGKLISATLGDGENAREFRVAIRLLVAEAPPSTIADIVADKSQATSFASRFKDMREGRIGMLDLILCRDLYKERKRQLLRDKNGVYNEVRSRQLAHKRAAISSGNSSLAEASNLVVLSSETCADIQARYGLDIDDFADRTKMFENLNAMIIVRVDRLNMRVKFYYDGIRAASSMGVNDIRVANKKSGGPDVMDIFDALKKGNAPMY